MSDDPRSRLSEAQRLLDAGDPPAALSLLHALTSDPDPNVVTDAWQAIGTASYRLDEEAAALEAWHRAAAAGGDRAWLGSRSVAEQLVREGHLTEAIEAYRDADRRAPPQERGAIANRIAWLLKETGHDFAARRQFNRARGAYASFGAVVTNGLIAINIGVFVVDALLGGGMSLMGSGGPLLEAGLVSGPLVASGEWWRILTSAFLHLGLVHIFFNMYALAAFGPVIEELFGHLEYLVIYLLSAIGGSVLTLLLTPSQSAAGASGAIFGLLGLAFVVSWRRHLVISRQARFLLSQAGGLILVNLVITFAVPRISWTGHLGGLLVGGLVGLLVAPGNVATIAGLFQRPTEEPSNAGSSLALRAAAYTGVAAVLAVGIWVAVQQISG